MSELIPDSLSQQPEDDPRRGRVGRIIGNTLMNFVGFVRTPMTLWIGAVLAEGVRDGDPTRTTLGSLLLAGLTYFNVLEGVDREQKRERKLRFGDSGAADLHAEIAEYLSRAASEREERQRELRATHSFPRRVLNRMTNPTYWVFEAAAVGAITHGLRERDSTSVATGVSVLLGLSGIAGTMEVAAEVRDLRTGNQPDITE